MFWIRIIIYVYKLVYMFFEYGWYVFEIKYLKIKLKYNF